MRKAGTRRNGVTRGRETALPLTSRRVWWRDAGSAVYGGTERRSRNGCCERKVLRQDGNPLPRNGAGQRRPAGSVRSMTADRTPTVNIVIIQLVSELTTHFKKKNFVLVEK